MEYPDLTLDVVTGPLADVAPQVPAHPYPAGTPRMDLSTHAWLWLRNASLIREAVQEMMWDGCSDDEIRLACEHAIAFNRTEYAREFRGSSDEELQKALEDSRQNNLGA